MLLIDIYDNIRSDALTLLDNTVQITLKGKSVNHITFNCTYRYNID